MIFSAQKIAYISPHIRGGAGRVIIASCNYFAELGNTVTLIFPKDFDCLSSDDSILKVLHRDVKRVAVNIYKRDNLEIWAGIERLANVFDRHKYSLVHCHTGLAAFSAAVARLKSRSKPKILATWHSSSKSRPTWMNVQDSYGFRMVDVLSTVSHHNRRVLESALNRRVHVVYPYIRAPVVTMPSRSDFRVESYLTSSAVTDATFRAPLITNLGELCQRKNQLALVKLVFDLKRLGYQPKLMLIGAQSDKNYVESICAAARALGVEEEVMLLGPLEDPWELIGRSDLFIFPSLSEGLGMAVVEAISIGVPTLFSSIEGLIDIKEICGDYCFRTFDPGDREDLLRSVLETLVMKRSHIMSKTVGCKVAVDRIFDKDQMLLAYKKLYYDLIN